MLNKYLVIALVVLAGLLTGAGWGLKRQHDRIVVQNVALKAASDALRSAEARQKQDAKALVAREAQIASERLKSSQRQRALDVALRKVPDWADKPVPKEVQDEVNDGEDDIHGRVVDPVPNGGGVR